MCSSPSKPYSLWWERRKKGRRRAKKKKKCKVRANDPFILRRSRTFALKSRRPKRGREGASHFLSLPLDGRRKRRERREISGSDKSGQKRHQAPSPVCRRGGTEGEEK